jgi:hypothetical protein
VVKEKRKSLRKLSNITSDLEVLIEEMIVTHDLQTGEVLNLINGYIQAHYVGANEQYEDGEHAIFYYGRKENLK